ncbi:hypothetical protein Nepgr_026267 [Nepenthes gracilis]|uniref:Uncharacterized protein n=1 Tax=Nepenthes gracilis TaxID=150966 RepID=A0AAD3T8S9_NEPGR|nr:hypothetical protein Nepgr_026267 [Nepenthes gracilis]
MKDGNTCSAKSSNDTEQNKEIVMNEYGIQKKSSAAGEDEVCGMEKDEIGAERQQHKQQKRKQLANIAQTCILNWTSPTAGICARQWANCGTDHLMNHLAVGLNSSPTNGALVLKGLYSQNST